MPKARALRGVLSGFLGAFSSRNAEFQGYWIFGFLVEQRSPIQFDLQVIAPDSSIDPVDAARHRAALVFRDQLQKHGFQTTDVASARLIMTRLHPVVEGTVWGPRAGYRMRLQAVVIKWPGTRFEREVSLFAAPHDPWVERYSMRS